MVIRKKSCFYFNLSFFPDISGSNLNFLIFKKAFYFYNSNLCLNLTFLVSPQITEIPIMGLKKRSPREKLTKYVFQQI